MATIGMRGFHGSGGAELDRTPTGIFVRPVPPRREGESRMEALHRRRMSRAVRLAQSLTIGMLVVLVAAAGIVLALEIDAVRHLGTLRAVESPSLEAPDDAAVPGGVAGPSVSVLGRSLLGREVTLVSFGAGPRRVLIIGGIHGNEYGSDVAERLTSYLGAHPSAVPAGTRVDIVPCANPDGRALDRRGNARHVDINRNFPTRNWRPMLWRGTSAGTLPGSEPETQMLLRVLAMRYERVISLHSRGGLVDYDGPGALSLARKMSRASGLPVVDIDASDPGYVGTLGMYGPERYGIPVITVELSSRQFTDRVRDMLLTSMR